jgi:hypothetical protein
MQPYQPTWQKVLIVVASGTLLIALGWVNYQFSLDSPGGNDFLARWVGARNWVQEGVSPYAPEVSLEAQQLIYGRAANPEKGEDVAHFVYPLPSMLFFAPFGFLPYNYARATWMTLLQVLLPVLILIGIRLARWEPKRWQMMSLMLFSILWYHGFRSVIVGQFAVIEAVLLAGGLLLIQQNQDGLAGVVLGLSIAKPQMSFLILPFIAIWAISRRRWSLLAWTYGSVIVLIGLSLAVLPGWPLDWIRQLLEYPGYTEIGPPVSIIAEGFPRIREPLNLALTGIAVAYLLWEWILSWGKSNRWFQWTAAMTLVITNLIAFRTATTNYVVLLPALCLMFGTFHARWGSRGSHLTWFVLIGILIGLWVLFLQTVQGNTESRWMYLPLPFITLLGLLWVRWWAVESPRLERLSR